MLLFTAEYEKEGKKGFFGMAKAIAGKIRDIFQAGMDRLRERFSKKVDDRAILGFDSLSDAWNKAKEAVSGVAGSIADTFRPHLDALKQVWNLPSMPPRISHKMGHLK